MFLINVFDIKWLVCYKYTRSAFVAANINEKV